MSFELARAPPPKGTPLILLTVDTPALLYRSFFSVPSTVRGPDGAPVNALLGAATTLLSVVEQQKPRAVVVGFGQESGAYRTALYPPYHAQRPPMPPELAVQFDAAPDFFRAFGWHVATDDTLEADDVIHSYARTEAEAGGHARILTGDRDLYQSVDDRVYVLMLRKGGAPPDVVDAAEVRERYGIHPPQVPDFIALRGDPSDGLPGAKGIGEKSAAELLRIHGTLEAVIAAAPKARGTAVKAIAAQADLLRVFRDIATIRRLDVKRPEDAPLDPEGASKAARDRGMNRLAERLLAKR